MRQMVQSLLQRDQEDSDFLEQPAAQPLGLSVEGEANNPWIGRRLGAYRLVRPIGAGGMSQVFLAEPVEEDIERQVAIKVIAEKAGKASLLRALRRERQIMARLDHPNIARSLDGGTTEEGLPYVVLEYIDGMPVTDFCDTARLTIAQRLVLFSKICDAVDYAHRHLVVHRDLKPSNILVTNDGEPKLLDFGVAKLLDATRSLPTEDLTKTQERFLTPQYASPEQIAGHAASTASDTFSLGVLLYELLTGLRPREVEGRSADARHDGSSRAYFSSPSTAATMVHPPGALHVLEPPDHRAEARVATPQQLQRQLAGDLDSIVLQCLAHLPEQRYRNVGELAEDIQRYLSGLPVKARSSHWSYHVEKFVRRHRLGVALGLLAFLGLGVLATGLIWQGQQMARERDRAQQAKAEAEEVTQFLTHAFLLSDPYQSSPSSHLPGDQITVQEVLDYSSERIRGELTDQPNLQARLMHTIGVVKGGLGEVAEATALNREALAIRRRSEDRPLEIIESLNALGINLAGADRLDEAEPLFAEALAMARQVDSGGENLLAESLTNQAMLWLMQGRELAAAEGLMREALGIRQEVLDPDHRQVVQSRLYLSQLLIRKGDLAEAEGILQQALESCVRAEGEDHAQVASILVNLAGLLTQLGNFEVAETHYLRVLEIQEGKLGEAHPNALQARAELGLFYREKGDYEASERTLLQTLEVRRRLAPDDHKGEANLLNNLGLVFLDQGQVGEAEAYFREALAILSAAPSVSIRGRPYYLRNLGIALHAQGKAAEAESLFRQAFELLEAEQGLESPNVANAMTSLASALVSLGRYEEALDLSRRAESILVDIFGSAHARVAMARGAQGSALAGLRRFEDAEPLLVGSLEGLRATAPNQTRALGVIRQHLVDLYEAWGRPDKAAPYLTANDP